MKQSKQAVINEILRFNRILTQQKYNSKGDKDIKRLIAENLKLLSEIEAEETAREIRAQQKRFKANLAACL